MPIIGVRARGCQTRLMIGSFCLHRSVGHHRAERILFGVGVSRMAGLSGENAASPKAWLVRGVGRFGTLSAERRLVEPPQLARMQRAQLAAQEVDRLEADAQVLAHCALVE